jgi:hypothetical protein
VRAPDGWRLDRALDLLERDAGAPALELGPFAVRSYRLTGGPRTPG